MHAFNVLISAGIQCFHHCRTFPSPPNIKPINCLQKHNKGSFPVRDTPVFDEIFPILSTIVSFQKAF